MHDERYNGEKQEQVDQTTGYVEEQEPTKPHQQQQKCDHHKWSESHLASRLPS
jgi:hypothetical protein